jgi:hypothetical protein
MTASGGCSWLTRPGAVVVGLTVTAVAADRGWAATATAVAAATTIVLTGVVTTLALVAALSSKKFRRDAALQVLRLLLVEAHLRR